MKKRQLYILVGLLMSASLLVGCALRGAINETEDSQADTVLELTSEEDSENTIVYKDVHTSEPYRTFEESLDVASHVVLAKCVDKYVEGRYTYAIFEPIETFKGTVEEETVKVRGENNIILYTFDSTTMKQYSYRNDLAKYEIGKEYVLVTEVDYSKFLAYDYHSILNDICIPKNSIKNSTMCGDVNIIQLSQSEGVFETYEKLVSYMRDIITQDTTPFEYDIKYIRSYNLEEIVEQTDVILRIKVTSQVVFARDLNTRCRGRVLEILKGGEDAAAEEIILYVPLNSVENNEEYIVLVKDISETNVGFSISSRRSVYPVTDTETMEKIRELIEQSK